MGKGEPDIQDSDGASRSGKGGNGGGGWQPKGKEKQEAEGQTVTELVSIQENAFRGRWKERKRSLWIVSQER